MRNSFHDFLFAKGFLVGEGDTEHAPEALVALAKLFNIRIVSNPGWASVGMVRVASRNLGENVPPPFYYGFPESVLKMPVSALVLDRLLHYVRTYGIGDFSRPGHSLFEEEVVRACFNEDVDVRELSIISIRDAIKLLRGTVSSLLASTRPLSESQYEFVQNYIEDYGYNVVVLYRHVVTHCHHVGICCAGNGGCGANGYGSTAF